MHGVLRVLSHERAQLGGWGAVKGDVRCAQAVGLRALVHGDTLLVGLHQVQSQTLLRLCRDHKRVRLRATYNVALVTTDLHLTGAHGLGLRFGHVVERARFLRSERHARFTSCDTRQDFRLLFVGSSDVHKPTTQDHGWQVRFKHKCAAKRFHDHGNFSERHARAAVLFGKWQAHEAQFSELVPHVFAPPGVRGADRFAGFGVVLSFQQATQGCTQLLLYICEFEIHFCPLVLNSSLRISTRLF